jgi:Arylsulfotransferase (ASST)
MLEDAAPGRVTRRRLLTRASSAAGAVAFGGAAFGAWRLVEGAPSISLPTVEEPGPVRLFRSRPDLRPAAVATAGAAGGSGYLLLGPGSKGGSQSGPLILDGDGEPVWFRPLSRSLWLANFTIGSYGGQPVLAWWEGVLHQPVGYGQGEAVVLDSSYRELRRIRAAGGRVMDMHELRLTPEGTVLFTCYPETVPADLSAIGGPRQGRVLESVIQELDLRSGRLLMEWRSLDHIPVSDSYRPLEDPYDYLHANSIAVLPDGNLLVSCRHTWAIYKLDRRTGEVIWTLGGKRSDFRMGDGAQFAWQHHAVLDGQGTMTVFDDGSDGPTKTEKRSRGLVLGFDDARRRVWLQRAYVHPKPLLAAAMGSVQILPNGHVLVGWGSQPYASEFSADGTLVADAAMTAGQQSYRAFRLPWQGTPKERPAIAGHQDPASGDRFLYASWNGATEVTHWGVETGPTASELVPVRVVGRAGFETTIQVGADARYARVTALDSSTRRLARSLAIRV